MGQGEHYPGKSADEFKFDSTVQVTNLAGIPESTKVIRHFPSLEKRIVDIDGNLGELYPRRSFLHTTYLLPNGNIYTGQWHDEKMHSVGKLALSDGTFLISDFLNGQLNGLTRIIKPNGDYFNGKIDGSTGWGSGVIIENGTRFQGNVQHSKPHGEGKQEGQGYKFEGTYEEGKKKKGTLTWNLQKQKPYFYEGTFENELFNGKGRLYNGEGYYEGQFKNGVKEGQGVVTFPNGSRYEGFFSNNLQHGRGKVLSARDQIISNGLWTKGKLLST